MKYIGSLLRETRHAFSPRYMAANTSYPGKGNNIEVPAVSLDKYSICYDSMPGFQILNFDNGIHLGIALRNRTRGNVYLVLDV